MQQFSIKVFLFLFVIVIVIQQAHGIRPFFENRKISDVKTFYNKPTLSNEETAKLMDFLPKETKIRDDLTGVEAMIPCAECEKLITSYLSQCVTSEAAMQPVASFRGFCETSAKNDRTFTDADYTYCLNLNVKMAHVNGGSSNFRFEGINHKPGMCAQMTQNCQKFGGPPHCYSGFCDNMARCVDCPTAVIQVQPGASFTTEVCGDRGKCIVGRRYKSHSGGTAEEQRRIRSRPHYYALYSSLHGGIITDIARMNVPLDDHMVHRGRAIFDTCSLVNGRVYRLQAHLDRFFNSALMSHIQMPYTRERLTHLVALTCAASQKRNASVRFWLSAGGGDFGVIPNENPPTLWILIFKPNYVEEAVREVTVLPHEVPMKPKLLANMKSNNYMLNCLVKVTAEAKGGRLGLWVDENGYIAEFSIASVMVVDKHGCIRTPPQDNVLTGVTFSRAWEILRNQNRDMKMNNISVVEAYEAKEIICLGGDTHIQPVIELDGKQIGDGKAGPIFKLINELIMNEADNGTHDCINVPYEELYETPARSRL